MTEKNVLKLNCGLLAALVLFLLVCATGPVAVGLGGGGAWLLAWPLTFVFVRFLAFSVLPVAVLTMLYIAWKKRRAIALTSLNTLLAVGLALAVWRVGAWSQSQSNSAFAKQFGVASPAEILKRNVVGQKLTSLPLVNLDGQQVDLREQVRRAQVTLVFFFATYNTAWSDNLKVAREIHRTMTQNDVLVIGICEQESEKTLKAFAAKHQMDFPLFRDTEGDYFRSLGLLGSVEQVLIVNKDGSVLAHPEANSSLKQSIKAVLALQTNK